MLRFVAAGILACSTLCAHGAESQTLEKALSQNVTVHFHEVSVAAAMDFLAMHGISVAARTSDVNLREHIALNVTNATMHDVMQAIAGALGAQWKRSGSIFVLSRLGPPTPTFQFAGPFRRRFVGNTGPEPDPEEAFAAVEESPSAVVTEEGDFEVGKRTISTQRHNSLLRLSPSGEWAVAEQWTSSSKVLAKQIQPKLTASQQKLLAQNGALSIADLSEAQVESLGEIWPDGKYHAVWKGRTLLIRR